MPVLTAAGLLLFDFQARMWGVRSRCGISRFKATNSYYASGEQINAPFSTFYEINGCFSVGFPLVLSKVTTFKLNLQTA